MPGIIVTDEHPMKGEKPNTFISAAAVTKRIQKNLKPLKETKIGWRNREFD